MGALHGVPDRKATLTLLRGKAEGQASVRVPDRWLSERYLNVVATGNLVIDDGRTEFRLERLRVGRLAVPQLLRAGISRTLVWTMQRDPDIRQMLDSVIQLRLDHSAVEVAARRGALNSRVIPLMLSPLLRCICDTWWSSAVQPIANHTDRHASVRPVTISFRSGLRRAFTSFAAACTVMSPCSTFTARSGAAACTNLLGLALEPARERNGQGSLYRPGRLTPVEAPHVIEEAGGGALALSRRSRGGRRSLCPPACPRDRRERRSVCRRSRSSSRPRPSCRAGPWT